MILIKDEPIIRIVETIVNVTTNLITYLMLVYLLQLYAEGRVVEIRGNVATLSGLTDESGEYQTDIPCDKVLSVTSDQRFATYECVNGYAKVITFMPETDVDDGMYKIVDSVIVHEHTMKRVSGLFTLTYIAE